MKGRNKTEDLKKLADAFYKNLEITPWEFGGIGLDPKRPFGNSSVCESMLEIIGWKKEGNDGYETCYADYQIDYVYNLYRDLIPFLRKNWRIYLKENEKVAETKVRNLEKEKFREKERAVGFLKDIFEALDKPAKELIDLLYNLRYKWDN